MRSQRLPPIAAGGMLEIIPVQGVFETNAYLYADDATGRGFIVDPGAMPERLLGAVEARGVAVEHILLTHGHFDHMGVAGQLAQALGVPVRMASEGRRFAEDPQMNLSAACGLAVVLASPAYFDAGSRPVFTAGMLGLEAIPAPGHTPDSVVYYSRCDGIAFVGDTVFRGAPGTPEFPGGDERALAGTLAGVIASLPEGTVLYSGHSGPTTVGRELRAPWFQKLLGRR